MKTEKPIAFVNKVGQPLKRKAMRLCGGCKNTEIGYLVLKLSFIRITITVTYLKEALHTSTKLMKWALTMQEFNVKFQYKAGKHNTAADFLSRVDPAENGEAR